MLDAYQVKLRLTQDKEVLAAMKKRKCLYKDKDGQDTYRVQYNSQIFYFKPGVTMTFGENDARNIQRNSWVLVGPDNDGEFIPALVQVAKWKMGELEPGSPNPKTTCNICQKDCKSVKGLVDHMVEEHSDEEDGDAGSTDYDTPLEEQLK